MGYPDYKRKTLSLSTGACCPDELCELHPWRCSRPKRTKPWAILLILWPRGWNRWAGPPFQSEWFCEILFSPPSIVCYDKSWVMSLWMRANINANPTLQLQIHAASALEIWSGFPNSILTFFIGENLKNTYKKNIYFENSITFPLLTPEVWQDYNLCNSKVTL